MKYKIGLTSIRYIGAGLLATALMFASFAPTAAEEKKQEAPRAAPAQRAAPVQHAAPQRAAPQRSAVPQRAAPQRAITQHAAPQRSTPRVVTPNRTPSRVVTPRNTERAVTTRRATTHTVAQPKVNSPVVGQPKARTNVAAPRVVTPRGTRTVTASALRRTPARGAGRTVIHGQNYSVWRSGYRVRHGGGWRTFVALSTLSAIMIGSNEYYPYAYITAPENYCEGLTEDGCELNWEQVQTEEGDIIDQCVAYCPWQQ
jgi:hypothetical protein